MKQPRQGHRDQDLPMKFEFHFMIPGKRCFGEKSGVLLRTEPGQHINR
jgi:hypothetical protein